MYLCSKHNSLCCNSHSKACILEICILRLKGHLECSRTMNWNLVFWLLAWCYFPYIMCSFLLFIHLCVYFTYKKILGICLFWNIPESTAVLIFWGEVQWKWWRVLTFKLRRPGVQCWICSFTLRLNFRELFFNYVTLGMFFGFFTFSFFSHK